MRGVFKGVALAVLALAPGLAAAEDAALVIAEGDYRRLVDAPGADRAAALAQALEAAGFQVTSALDPSADAAWQAVAQWRSRAEGADRLLVFLSGHMVSTARESYLLTRYAEAPSDLSVGGEGLALGPILDTLASHPGQAVLMLAPSGDVVTGPGLNPGAEATMPQGVTLLSGPAAGLLQVARDVLLVPGAQPATALAPMPGGVAASGFVSDAVPFLPRLSNMSVTPPRFTPPVDDEAAFWDVVQTMNSAEAYEAYLGRYPSGRFGASARAAIDAIKTGARARHVATEQALGLNSDARRQVQRHLALLGFDPHGIDGVFGPGSRAAIADWQRASGFPSTGYLAPDDLRTLTSQGQARAAQLEAEAEARRAEQERLDRAYWNQTGRQGDEPGLRAYLTRYPDGVYADVAQARLDEIEAATRAQAQVQERQMWDRVKAKDTVAAYKRYLTRYPSGAFADAAQARIAKLTAASDRKAQIEAAKAEEAHVAGTKVARLLVETRLKALGFGPVTVDGTFDAKTRRAIRKFQRARDLFVSGYVTQETMVHLLTAG